MFGNITGLTTRSLTKMAIGTLGGLALFGGVALAVPSIASATATNVFTLKGANPGSIKTSGSIDVCNFGKTFDNKGYVITIGHMTGSIKGGTGKWAMTLDAKKIGKNTVTKADVTSTTDSSMQNSGEPTVEFVETSGTVTYNGAKGSFNLTVEPHSLGSTTYGKTSTFSGSWSCSQ